MWSRKSTDNGVTWLPDDSLSDVASPLPAQPDSDVQAVYAGDYDYGTAIASKHLTSWVDGRVAVSGQSQQDAFTDKESVSGATPTPTPTPGPIQLQGKGKKVGGINTSRLKLRGATSANIDVYRDGAVIATTPNDGLYDDSTGTTGQASFIYKVCEAGTQTCSNTVTVNFPP